MDTGSITAASELLGLTISATSRTLGRLEEKLQTTLLRRTTRRLELTEEGAKLLDPTGTLQPGITFAPPEGDAGTGIALPPLFDATQELHPCSLPLTLAQQRDKAMALGMMHDLQPAPPFKRRVRRVLQRWLAGRKASPYGENEFFRKAVRRHELFWRRDL